MLKLKQQHSRHYEPNQLCPWLALSTQVRGGNKLFSVVCNKGTRNKWHKMELEYEEKIFKMKVTEHWDRLLKGGGGVSSADLHYHPGYFPV